MDGSTIVTLAFAAFFIVLAWSAIKVVPQSKVFVVERFWKFSKTLPAGINIIIPIITLFTIRNVPISTLKHHIIIEIKKPT